MRNRKSRVGRQSRRQRFLLQLLATLSVGTGSTVLARETELAYYAFDSSENVNHVQTVSAGDGEAQSFRSILQTQAFQEVESSNDGAISSSSDVPRDDYSFLEPPAPEASVAEDVDAVVDQAVIPAPMAQPYTEIAPQPLDAPGMAPMAAPVAAPVRSRPSLGAVAGSYSAAPNMIGDFFGGSFLIGSLIGHTVSLAGGDRRFKIAENVSPVPQDRVFFNYNHFHNALRDINGDSQALDRFTFGFEKTFFNEQASFETRLPFANALDSDQLVGSSSTRAAELGNLAFAFKANMLSGRNWMISAGTTMTVPTGDDYQQFNGTTRNLLIENESVHLAPFLGYLLQPKGLWFAQGFIQADFDLNGNDVYSNANGYEGVLQDQNLMFVDASIGRWLYRNCDPCDCVSGVAAMAELHYTTTLNDTDGVAGVSNPFNRMDILNATGALNFQFGRTALRVGGALPLRGDEENLFDAEIMLQLNRNY